MKKIIADNEKETLSCGEELAKQLKGGEVLALYGDLGAGKTKFLQGLAKGLGVRIKVNSPTFNIMKIYRVAGNGKINTFCHIDAYRLSSGKDLDALGVEEYFYDKNTVTAIEWAERVEEILPKKRINVKIKQISGNIREIFVAGFDSKNDLTNYHKCNIIQN